MAKEAKARLKINKLLEDAGWRFFDSHEGKATIILENNIKITESILNDMGEDFDKVKNGYIDFLLLDEKGFPFIILEAKAEDKNPLFGKEQACKYALSQNCRFVILSNGNIHYFWDIERGNPNVLSRLPSPETVEGSKNELLDEEFDKFDSRYLPKEEYFDYAKTMFKAYIVDTEFREIIENGNFAYLNVTPFGESFKKLSPELRKAILEYVKDFVSLNRFIA